MLGGERVQNGDLPGRHAQPFESVALLLTLTFVLTGLCLIPYPGLQNDEVLFAGALYAPGEVLESISVFKKPLPTMLMGYLGALKAWLYAPILAIWQPSAWSVRLPVVLLGACTLWLFFRLSRRLLDRRGALAACALLAADTTFVITTTFDWGPVVLQRLFAVAGVWLLVRFHDTYNRLYLGTAFLVLGLALWDKALFGWILAGLAAAAACTAPGAIRRALGWRNMALALACFLIGVSPLIRHTWRTHMDTLHSAVGWSLEGWRGKLHVASSTLDGSSLIGYLTVDDPAGRSGEPRNALERLSVAVDTMAGRPRHGWLGYALGLSLLLLPLLWRSPARRPMLFSLVLLLVAWGLMFLGRGVGGSSHHVSLLWPWPHLMIAAAFAGASRRLGRAGVPALILAVGLISVKALLATNVHLSQYIRNGAAGSWTDAIHGLSDYLGTQPGKQVVVLDWGVLEPLRLLHRGRLPLIWGADPLRTAAPGPDELRLLGEMAGQPGRLFVSHTDSHEQFAGVNRQLVLMLDSLGLRRDVLKVIPDSHGRPVYEVWAVRR